MKRRKFYLALIAIIMVFVSGCENKVETGNNMAEVTEDTETDEVVNEDSAPTEKPSDEVQDIDSLITEKADSELDLKEYYYSFEDRTVGSTGDDVFSRNEFEFEFVGDGFYYETTGKVSLYASNGVRMGYTKEEVDFSVVAACGDWCYFYLDSDKRYARLSDIEANSLGPEELDARSVARMAEEMAKAQPQSQSQATAPAEQNPVQETVPDTTVEEPVEVPAESDKYTPEEAISVYRSLMEAGGMTWTPSLKGNWDETIGQYPIEEWNLHMDGYNGGSWGTGWIYLDKGMPEWTAETNLESAAIGNHGGDSWTNYYFEVTGSDDECVYITEWCD